MYAVLSPIRSLLTMSCLLGFSRKMFNGNGLVDTGNLLEHKQPEKVLFYKLEDGKFLIDIPEMTELEQHIDVEEMFK